MLLFDVMDLKNPVAHASHLGWVVAEPLTMVCLPGGHFVWAVQESVLVLGLKNPVAHASHCGCDPLGLVYLPRGHTADGELHWTVVVDS